MKKTLTLLTILALGLTACNKVELQDTPEQTPETFTKAPACFFNLSASFGGDEATKAVTIGENTATSSFEAGDKIYVYIERTSNSPAFGYDAGALTPLTIENINGATCDLSGTLKFYYNNGAEAYTPQENDVVHLLYNLNGNLSSPDNPYFAIERLNGAKDGYVDPTGLGYSSLYTWGANHFDFAEAVMIVTAVSGAADPGYTLTLGKVGDPTDPNVSFASPQSMFRQRLEFTDNLSNPVVIDPASILKFSVSTETNKVAFRYYPLSPDPAYAYSYTPLEISSPTVDGNGDIYFSLMFNDVNKNEALIITAEDAGGNVYTATKNAPTGGFANGKYYYGTATLAWLKCKQPTATYEDYLGKWAKGTRVYTIESKVDGESYSISGLNGQGDYEVEAKFEDHRLVLYEQIVAQDGDKTVALQGSGNKDPGYPDGTPVVIFSALYDKGNNQLSINHESAYNYIDFFTYEGQTMTDDVYEEIPVSLIPYVPDIATYLYYEDFESDNSSSWTFIDADGDGKLWWRSGASGRTYSGDYVLTSASYDNATYGALHPDNWAFTPPLTLTSNNYLSFWVRAQDPNYPAEHYAVYITDDAPTAANLGDCTVLLAEQEYPNGNYVALAGDGYYQRYVIQIPSSFDGKTVYIGFRHFNCSDQFQLTLDDVAIAQGNPVTD